MRLNPLGIVLLTTSTLLLPVVPAWGTTCSLEQANAADALIDKLDSWAKIYAFFQAYSACDDGGIADGVSDAVMRLLADHWDMSGSLFALVQKNGKFKKFVLMQIDSTADTAMLERTRSNAVSRCRPDMSGICKDIKRAVDEALK